jgi:putative addiction module component (TIGR02574 family)
VNPATVLEAALALPENERMHIVERLLETLGPETDGVDEGAFIAELNRRSEEIEQASTELVPWVELKNEPF